MIAGSNVGAVTDRLAGVVDAELMTRIAVGDRRALDELYGRHAGWLTVRLERRCGDPEAVDSAVQDTFVDVWKKAGSYKPTGEVGAWIWTIGIRRLIDHMRKRPAPTPLAPALLPRVLSEEVPLALGHTALGQAFAALEPELQAVLAATALDGLSNREAARLLRVPTGTVKSRLARARVLLKEKEVRS